MSAAPNYTAQALQDNQLLRPRSGGRQHALQRLDAGDTFAKFGWQYWSQLDGQTIRTDISRPRHNPQVSVGAGFRFWSLRRNVRNKAGPLWRNSLAGDAGMPNMRSSGPRLATIRSVVRAR